MLHALFAHQYSPLGVVATQHQETARRETITYRVRCLCIRDTPSLYIATLDRKQMPARNVLHLNRQDHRPFKAYCERVFAPVIADGNAERQVIQPVGFIRSNLHEPFRVALKWPQPPASPQVLIRNVYQECCLKIAGAAVSMRRARAVNGPDDDDASAFLPATAGRPWRARGAGRAVPRKPHWSAA